MSISIDFARVQHSVLVNSLKVDLSLIEYLYLFANKETEFSLVALLQSVPHWEKAPPWTENCRYQSKQERKEFFSIVVGICFLCLSWKPVIATRKDELKVTEVNIARGLIHWVSSRSCILESHKIEDYVYKDASKDRWEIPHLVLVAIIKKRGVKEGCHDDLN